MNPIRNTLIYFWVLIQLSSEMILQEKQRPLQVLAFRTSLATTTPSHSDNFHSIPALWRVQSQIFSYGASTHKIDYACCTDF